MKTLLSLALACVLGCRSSVPPAPPVAESDAGEIVADLDTDGLESDVGDVADISFSDVGVPDVASQDLPIWPGFAEMPILSVSKVIVPPGGCDPYHALPVPPGQSFAGVEPVVWTVNGYSDPASLRTPDGALVPAPVQRGMVWSRPGETISSGGLTALGFGPAGETTCCCWKIYGNDTYLPQALARHGDWLFASLNCGVKDPNPFGSGPVWLKIPVGKGCQGGDGGEPATPIDPTQDPVLGPSAPCNGFETFSMVALGNDKVLVLWRPDQTKLFREIAVFETGKPVATFPFDPPLPAEHAIVDLVRGNDGLIYVMLRDLQWRLRRGTFRAYSDNGKLVRDFGYVPGYPGRMAVAMDGDVYFGVHFGPIYWIEHGTTTPVPLSGTFLNEMRKYAIVVAE